MLKKEPLRHPFNYVQSPNNKIKRVEPSGEIVKRTLLGNKNDFKEVEASKFLEKLNRLTLEKEFSGGFSRFKRANTIKKKPKFNRMFTVDSTENV